MSLAPPRMVLRRTVVAAPFLVSAFALAGRSGWPTTLFWAGFAWAIVAVAMTNGLGGPIRRPTTRVIAVLAAAAGQSAWVWGAMYLFADSLVLATLIAMIAVVFFVVGWAWASRPRPALPPQDAPTAPPRRKSRATPRSASAAPRTRRPAG